MKLIQTITVGAGGASSIDFNNIPQIGYTDLFIVAGMRSNGGATIRSSNIRVNGSTSGYSERMLETNGTSITSVTTSGSLINWSLQNDTNSTANTFSNVGIYIPNYAASGSKVFSIDSIAENNASMANSRMTYGMWANAAAITSVSLLAESGTSFLQYSTASLYGITAGNLEYPTATIKATGGTIFQAGGYAFHVFTSSGTFTTTSPVTADVMVIGGGGGSANPGGGSGGSGGGAGGFQVFSNQSLNGSYTLTVGAGGAGTGGYTPGSGSTFGSLTTSNGGGSWGGNGGSGGGGTGMGGSAGAGTAGQGNAGGAGGYNGGGGGGGAGSAGSNGSAAGGAGGLGNTAYISWAALTGTGVNGGYAGGGGGGGGYANGGGSANHGGAGGSGNWGGANPGVANTGGGAGGNGWNGGNGGSGGSGLIIVRYA